jgi:hypothetical protein
MDISTSLCHKFLLPAYVGEKLDLHEECHLPGCGTICVLLNRHLGGTSCLHIQGEENQQAMNSVSSKDCHLLMRCYAVRL